MKIKNDKIYCYYLNRTKQKIALGETVLDCSAGKTMICTYPETDISVGECTRDVPDFEPDMTKCSHECPEYKPSEIAICEIHGEFIEKEGCTKCIEFLKSDRLSDFENQPTVSVIRYILFYGSIFLLMGVAVGYFKRITGFKSIPIDIIAIMFSSYLTAYLFAKKHKRTFKSVEYWKILIGTSALTFFIELLSANPIRLIQKINTVDYMTFAAMSGLALLIFALILLFPALAYSDRFMLSIIMNQMKKQR